MNDAPPKEFFVLYPPDAPPAPPDCWSWSSLACWRRCPRQWWLLRSHYPNAPTPYPQPVFAATIEGLLLHNAMERFAAHITEQRDAGVTDYQAVRASFPVRRSMQQRLRSLLAQNDLPRANPAQLLARVSVDACVNAFRPAAAKCMEEARSKSGAGGSPKANALTGAEMWLSSKAPRLCGRIDYLHYGALTDFKTGDPKREDANQVRFYALLVWLATGTLPIALTLAYLRADRLEPVDVPSVDEVQAMAATIAMEIQAIEDDISRASADARPSVDNCPMCPVKQLCSQYWIANETEPLRLSRGKQVLESTPQWMDLEVMALPAQNASKSYIGEATIAQLGTIDLRIAAPHVLPNCSPTGARLLNARVQARDGRWSVLATVGTEVFWIE